MNVRLEVWPLLLCAAVHSPRWVCRWVGHTREKLFPEYPKELQLPLKTAMWIWQRIKGSVASRHQPGSCVREAVRSEKTEIRRAGRGQWPGDVDGKPARCQQVWSTVTTDNKIGFYGTERITMWAFFLVTRLKRHVGNCADENTKVMPDCAC